MNTPKAPSARALARLLRAVIVFAAMVGICVPQAMSRTSAFKQGAAPLMLAQQDDIGPGAASAAASAASGGRVLGVRRVRSANDVIYKVKVLLPGGRVRTVTVNGRTGQVRS